ncbi:hypothetical protein CBR_g39923 [Chara braunii]|uniref:Uncharacterized protein n=1 Tax=Chara braunii TaxID=69332 RepID=A0A388K1J7_CHABU|nr:hypothetical protein CBR_g39923 [Chara braunii]GBG63919.1 hypothetical protein CBR_g39923 [Chara braunii]|eukprot:GBG63918.1 hypothetical protein CBR_g39923 [Chara braunii]
MVSKRGHEGTDDEGEQGHESRTPMGKAAAKDSRGKSLSIRKTKKKRKGADQAKLMDRALRFLQTVASGLILEVGNVGERGGLSVVELRKALANAIKELPRGRLRRTLESDLSHFARILAGRVEEARTGKIATLGSDKGPDGIGRPRETSHIVEVEVENSLQKALGGEVLSNHGYKGAAMAAISAVDLVGKKVEIPPSDVNKWHRAFERLFAARRPPPFVLVVAYAEFARTVFRRAANGGGEGDELAYSERMWARCGLKSDCAATCGRDSRVVNGALRDVVVAEGVLKAVHVAVESLSAEGVAAIAAVAPAVEPLRTAVASVAKVMTGDMAAVGDGSASVSRQQQQQQQQQLKKLSRLLIKAVKSLVARVEAVIVSQKHSGGLPSPCLRIYPPSFDPLILPPTMRKRLKTALMGFSFRESFFDDAGAQANVDDGDAYGGNGGGASALLLTKENVMARNLAERVAAEIFVIRVCVEALRVRGGHGGGGGGGEGRRAAEGGGVNSSRHQQHQRQGKAIVQVRTGNGRIMDLAPLADSQEKIHSLRLIAADLFVSLLGSRCGALLDLLLAGPPGILSILRTDEQLLIQRILYEAAINGYINKIRSGGWGCKSPKRESWSDETSMVEYFKFISLTRKTTEAFRASGERSRAVALATASANAWVPPGVFYKLLASGGEAGGALPSGMPMPATSSPADLRNLSVWLVQSASEESLEMVRDLCLGSDSETPAAGREYVRGSKSSGGRKHEEDGEELFFIDRVGEKMENSENATEDNAVADSEFERAAIGMLEQARGTLNDWDPAGAQQEVEDNEDGEQEEDDDGGTARGEHEDRMITEFQAETTRAEEDGEGEGVDAMQAAKKGSEKKSKVYSGIRKPSLGSETKRGKGRRRRESAGKQDAERRREEEGEDNRGVKKEGERESRESGDEKGKGENLSEDGKGKEGEEELKGEEEGDEEDVDLVGTGGTQTKPSNRLGFVNKASNTDEEQQMVAENVGDLTVEKEDKSGREVGAKDSLLSGLVMGGHEPVGRVEMVPALEHRVSREQGAGGKSGDRESDEQSFGKTEVKSLEVKKRGKESKQGSTLLNFLKKGVENDDDDVEDEIGVDEIGEKTEDGKGSAELLDGHGTVKKRKRSLEGERKVRSRNDSKVAQISEAEKVVTSEKGGVSSSIAPELGASALVEQCDANENDMATSLAATTSERTSKKSLKETNARRVSGLGTDDDGMVFEHQRREVDKDHGELCGEPSSTGKHELQSGNWMGSGDGCEAMEDTAVTGEEGKEVTDFADDPFPLASSGKKHQSRRKAKMGSREKLKASDPRLSGSWRIGEVSAGEDKGVDKQDEEDVAMGFRQVKDAPDFATPQPFVSSGRNRETGRKLGRTSSRGLRLGEANADEEQSINEQGEDCSVDAKYSVARNLSDAMLTPSTEKDSKRAEREGWSQSSGGEKTAIMCTAGDPGLSEQEQTHSLIVGSGSQVWKRHCKETVVKGAAADVEDGAFHHREEGVIASEIICGLPASGHQVECATTAGKMGGEGKQKSHHTENDEMDVCEEDDGANDKDGDDRGEMVKAVALSRSAEKKIKKEDRLNKGAADILEVQMAADSPEESDESSRKRKESARKSKSGMSKDGTVIAVGDEEVSMVPIACPATLAADYDRSDGVAKKDEKVDAKDGENSAGMTDLPDEAESGRKRKKSARKRKSSMSKDGTAVEGCDEEVDAVHLAPVSTSPADNGKSGGVAKNDEKADVKDIKNSSGTSHLRGEEAQSSRKLKKSARKSRTGNNSAEMAEPVIIVDRPSSTERKTQKTDGAKCAVACSEVDTVEVGNGGGQGSLDEEGCMLLEDAEGSKKQKKSGRRRSCMGKDGPGAEGADEEASPSYAAFPMDSATKSDKVSKKRKSIRSDSEMYSECLPKIEADADGREGSLREKTSVDVEMEEEDAVDVQRLSFVTPSTEKGKSQSVMMTTEEAPGAVGGQPDKEEEAICLPLSFVTPCVEKEGLQSGARQHQRDSDILENGGQAGVAGVCSKEMNPEGDAVASACVKSGTSGKKRSRKSAPRTLGTIPLSLTPNLQGEEGGIPTECQVSCNEVVKMEEGPSVSLLSAKEEPQCGGSDGPAKANNEQGEGECHGGAEDARMEADGPSVRTNPTDSQPKPDADEHMQSQEGDKSGHEHVQDHPAVRRSPRGLKPAAPVAMTGRSRARYLVTSPKTRRTASAAASMSVDSEADISFSQSVEVDQQNPLASRGTRRRRGSASSSRAEEQEADGPPQVMLGIKKEASDENAPVVGLEKDVGDETGRGVDIDLSEEGEENRGKNAKSEMEEVTANLQSEEAQQDVEREEGEVGEKSDKHAAQEVPSFISPPRTRSGLVRAASPVMELSKRRKRK